MKWKPGLCWGVIVRVSQHWWYLLRVPIIKMLDDVSFLGSVFGLLISGNYHMGKGDFWKAKVTDSAEDLSTRSS